MSTAAPSWPATWTNWSARAPGGCWRAALEAEVDAYLAAHHEFTDERGHRLVRRNGHAQPRQVTTTAGQVELVCPGSTTGGSTR